MYRKYVPDISIAPLKVTSPQSRPEYSVDTVSELGVTHRLLAKSVIEKLKPSP